MSAARHSGGRTEFEACLPGSPGPAIPDEVAQIAKSHSCLIDVPGVRRGSGYLVNWRSRNWVITNHHIIRTKDDAAKAVVTFDFTSVERQARGQVTRARLDSARFYTNERLDCTLAELAVSVDRAGAPLPDPPPMPVKGAIVHIIHYPNGQPRHVSSERVEAVLDEYIRCGDLIHLLSLLAHPLITFLSDTRRTRSRDHPGQLS